MSHGQIFTVTKKDDKWTVKNKVNLPDAPNATVLTNNNEFLIVTFKGLIKVDNEFKIETLISEGFWCGLLSPNSILIEGQTIYIGMRGGILRAKLNDITKQEWLTKK